MLKSQPLLQEHDSRLGMVDNGSESISSNSSFTDSYSDGSELANWEDYVADDGSLFYAEYLPNVKQPFSGGQMPTFTRNSSLRLGKKLTRRQQQQQQQQTTQKQLSQNNKHNGNHNHHLHNHVQQQQKSPPEQDIDFKFSHIKSSHDDSCKQLDLVITAADRFRFGRRSTAVESILGFRVVPFTDKPECLMVDGFVHDMPAMLQQGERQSGGQAEIKRGDWFKSLDDIDIRTSNVDDLLLQFVEPSKVCLKFQGTIRDAAAETDGAGNTLGFAGATGSERAQTLRKIENFAMFADSFEQLLLPPTTSPAPPVTPSSTATTPMPDMPFGLLLLPPECYQHDQYKDSLYFYPESATTNFLYKARGSFLTLNAVLSEELQTKPLTSRLLVEQVPYFVTYRALNGFLVLFAYVAEHLTMSECGLRSDELISYMLFAFPTLSLENFTNGNESSVRLRTFLRHFCEIQRIRLLASRKARGCQFEELLKESRSMPLPKEAQLRIFDALSEMEAMDYRHWNDEPLTTHREFFIFGSVLYYDYYMLASQLPVEVRASVEGFLRCRGIFNFISAHSVREMYVWEEIALPNATGRYFLTICTRSHLILAVILKIFDAPDMTTDQTISPSLFYIEEIQETLDHLIQCGIESLAMFWSISNKRPEILDKSVNVVEAPADKDTRKLETFLKTKLTVSNSGGSAGTGTIANSAQRGYDEDAQLGSSLGGSSIHSLTTSEDESSRKRLTASNAAEDSDSGSDWDNFAEQHPLHYGLNTDRQSQMTESLWKEINNVVPVKISAGWKNSVFYYVYLDIANGSLFCPLKATTECFQFLHEMRKACHVIHEVLQNSQNFRRQITELPKSNSKAVLAVKEHGMTIEVKDSVNQLSDSEAEVKGRFVVVGRLFHSPTKEVYVCHRPDVPQNMVEMAFRLSFFSVG